MKRREFLKTAIVAGAAVAARRVLNAETAATCELVETVGTVRDGMIYRPLGTTGEKVSLIGLGGFHIGQPFWESNGIKLVRGAIDNGINFLDNSWDYHNGKSEKWMGDALRGGYRHKVFLMTKIDGRTRAAAARQIDESLARLRTDHLDLLQFHEIIRMEDPDRIFAPGGAIEAVLEAQRAGKVRFIGFTGHKDPRIHLHMLEVARRNHFRFDTVQMPLNIMDAQFRSFQREVLPILVREKIGVLGMKPLGEGILLQSRTVTAEECLHYAMSLPVSTVITGIDRTQILQQDLNAVRDFKPLTRDRIDDLLARTRQAAAAGRYEKYKTSTLFDSTAKNPQWLAT